MVANQGLDANKVRETVRTRSVLELLFCVIKCVSDVAPGRFRAPAWALVANLGKDLTEGPGTPTGAGRVVLIIIVSFLFIA